MIWICPLRVDQFKGSLTPDTHSIMIYLMTNGHKIVLHPTTSFGGETAALSCTTKVRCVRIFYTYIIKNNILCFTEHTMLLKIQRHSLQSNYFSIIILDCGGTVNVPFKNL